ncbi:hypothetical protein SFR_7015 (plasmid) [Streptomyces sp. FR-008]|nr:hypothetical protein SFR_7015 [Streptomyces sp. FR-008]
MGEEPGDCPAVPAEPSRGLDPFRSATTVHVPVPFVTGTAQRTIDPSNSA